MILCFNFFAGLVLDVILVGTLKTLFRRSRPDYSVHKEYAPVLKVDSFSFPSGHTSRAVFVALFCWFLLGKNLGLFAILWCGATGASRIVMGRHYLSDVLFGAAAAVVNFAILTRGNFDASNLLLDDASVSTIINSLPVRLPL